MSSKPVWVWLPGETEPTRTGTFTLGGTAASPVGTFEYDPGYVENNHRFSLDQRQLLRFKGVAKATNYQGVFDVFRDARPEGFGMDWLQKRRDVDSLSDLEALEFCAGDAVGAVQVCEDIAAKAAFHPTPSQDMFDVVRDLDVVQTHEPMATRLRDLLSTGLGGERPKFTVMHKGQWWIAKFAGPKDDPTSPLREYLCMKLASLVGIEAAEVEWVQQRGRAAVLIRRFDRLVDESGHCLRHHFASAATVLGAAAATRDAPGRTYLALALQAGRWGVQGQLPELWRRMAFNVLVGNGDDHPRNHGFLRTDKGWRLSPAYDIAPYTPHGGKGLDVKSLSMGVLRNGEAGATADNLLLAAKQFGLDYGIANDFLDHAYQMIHDSWDRLAQEAGAEAIVPSAFVLPPRAQRISVGVWKTAR